MNLRTSLLVFVVGLLFIAASGCPATDCTAEIRYSVIVEVVDELGEPVEDAAVTFDEGGGVEEPCLTADGIYRCGQEVPGQLTIRVDHPGYEPAEQTVIVHRNECHVLTEELDFALVPLP
jgi:hypothetical protein